MWRRNGPLDQARADRGKSPFLQKAEYYINNNFEAIHSNQQANGNRGVAMHIQLQIKVISLLSYVVLSTALVLLVADETGGVAHSMFAVATLR